MPKLSQVQPLTDAERDMVDANRGLVVPTIQAMRWAQVTDDSTQAGMLGLIRAAQKYDPAMGYAFSTYATYWIRQKVGNHRKNDALIRIPRHVSDGRSRKEFKELAARSARIETIAQRGEEMRTNEPAVTDDIDADAGDRAAAVRSAVASLPDRDHEVVARRMRGESTKAIGDSFGVSRERVRQIEIRALARLRETLAAYA